MENFYDILKFLHVMSFVFMSVPLFNLIVVNERALFGPSFNYYADRYMENIGPESDIPEDIVAQLKPYRVRRKKMATFCLFLVITIIILGMQVYTLFDPIVTVALIILAGLFSWHVSKTLIRFGWV